MKHLQITANTLHSCLLALTCALFLCCGTVWAQTGGSKYFYRYKNNQGVTVLDDHVPPEFVKNGYQVLTPDLRVIKTIPRQLTGAEGKRQREAEEAARRQAAWDKRLLLRYSSIQDIQDARDRALAEFDARIKILQSNLHSIKHQIEGEQARAADIERRGQPVPASITGNIDDLKQEISVTETSIQSQRQDKEATRQSYERDIERFKSLKDLVDLRRKVGEEQTRDDAQPDKSP